jgi:hypothetical protein
LPAFPVGSLAIAEKAKEIAAKIAATCVIFISIPTDVYKLLAQLIYRR